MVVAPLILYSRGGRGSVAQACHAKVSGSPLVTHCDRWVCTDPQGKFVLSQSPTDYSLSQESMGKRGQKCSGLFCAWRSSKSCSLCTHALVKSVEWRRFLWICTSFVCRKVDSTPWCPLRPSWLPAVPQHHPALPWQPFCCWLRACTHASLSAVSSPGTWTADTPWPWEAMCLYCAAIWWERQPLVQLGNESLEGPPLSPSLSSNSAHPSPGFMNPLVTQFSSAKQHGSTTCATCCSDRW